MLIPKKDEWSFCLSSQNLKLMLWAEKPGRGFPCSMCLQSLLAACRHRAGGLRALQMLPKFCALCEFHGPPGTGRSPHGPCGLLSAARCSLVPLCWPVCCSLASNGGRFKLLAPIMIMSLHSVRPCPAARNGSAGWGLWLGRAESVRDSLDMGSVFHYSHDISKTLVTNSTGRVAQWS